jgi:hypothetical protein
MHVDVTILKLNVSKRFLCLMTVRNERDNEV